MGLPIPVYSYEVLRRRATAFLAEHNRENSIPVPIEQIVEFQFSINIIPIPGLHRAYDIDAFLSSDLTSLMVDQGVLESTSPNRYRFSLAHELAHAVLHKEVYAQFSFSNINEWKSQISAISDEDLGWLEWQAYSFAGLILVPGEPLADKLKEELRLLREKGISVTDSPDPAKDYICNWIGRFFEVSAQVVDKRLDKDELWPPPGM